MTEKLSERLREAANIALKHEDIEPFEEAVKGVESLEVRFKESQEEIVNLQQNMISWMSACQAAEINLHGAEDRLAKVQELLIRGCGLLSALSDERFWKIDAHNELCDAWNKDQKEWLKDYEKVLKGDDKKDSKTNEYHNEPIIDPSFNSTSKPNYSKEEALK